MFNNKNTELGFGLMRLPQSGENFDFEEVNKMVDEAIKNKVTYFDTAYIYYSGKSEEAVKIALTDRHKREDFRLATKLPCWEMKDKSDCNRIFQEQCKRTGVDYFDYYLLHSIERPNYDIYEKFDCFNFILKLKEEGKIRHAGFSFHGDPELLDKVLTEHPEMEFVQLQINYVDWENKIVHSGGNYEVARKHNIPIIIMEPVKGGMLSNLTPKLDSMLKEVNKDKSAASWAMRFCASLDGVMTILSGMSNMDQMKDNIKTINDFNPLTNSEREVLDVVKKELLSVPAIPCTSCRYCIESSNGCPVNIRIPDVISALNTVKIYGDHDRPHFFYGGIASDNNKASDCLQCGACESVCPQHLQIIDILKEASLVFDK